MSHTVHIPNGCHTCRHLKLETVLVPGRGRTKPLPAVEKWRCGVLLRFQERCFVRALEEVNTRRNILPQKG
jgi:hypothetical protein